MAQELLLMNPRRRRRSARRARGPLGRFIAKRNPESRSERSRAARRGWARRRTRRNPESERKRSLAARRGWMHRRLHRNPESERERSIASRLGWRRRRTRRNPIGGDIGATVTTAAYGALGALALDAIFGYLPLPASIAGSGTPLNYAAKGIGALALGWVAEKAVGSRIAKDAADGALTVILHEAGRAAITKFSPSIGAKLGDLQPVFITPGVVTGRFNSYTGAPMLGNLQYTGTAAPLAVQTVPSGI